MSKKGCLVCLQYRRNKIIAMSDDFDKIVNKYSDAMFRCAYTYCNNRQDAEDIIQEVFYKYLLKKPSFKDESHEKAWFLRVTINTSKNYVHSFWHRNVECIQEDISYINSEEEEIWELVRKLPEKYRVVIELHYLEGYSIKEIAEILNKNNSTVGTWFERAKKMLKECMKG
jgi:RNA polymerase sigma-70 factor (ECF subfamily)